MEDLKRRLTLSPLLSQVQGLSHGFTNNHLTREEKDRLDTVTATARQVHGDTLVWASRFEKRQREADGIATFERGLPVGVYSADCTPVLTVALDAFGRPFAVMAVHAGWRGTAKGIAGGSLRAFAAEAGRKGGDLRFLAAVGPCIGPQSFEVGDDVVQAFPRAVEAGLAKFLRLEGDKRKFLFDLPGENLRQLKAVRDELGLDLRIDHLAQCTLERVADYPSYRREGEKAGRILSFIRIDG